MNFCVVYKGVQLIASVDFAKEQVVRMFSANNASQLILSSLKLHVIHLIPEFFSATLKAMDIDIDRRWILSEMPDRPVSFTATAQAADLPNFKIFDAIKDVSNVQASTIHITVTKVLGKGASCKMTVYFRPK